MPRITRLLAALIAAPIAVISVAAFAAPGGLILQLKQSERVPLGGAVTNVIIDDPDIADVAMVDNHSVVLIGKGYGSTGILVLGKNGRTLLHSQVAVVAPDFGPVTVYNGAAPTEFSCVRRCQQLTQPAPVNDERGFKDSEAGDNGRGGSPAQPSPNAP